MGLLQEEQQCAPRDSSTRRVCVCVCVEGEEEVASLDKHLNIDEVLAWITHGPCGKLEMIGNMEPTELNSL